MTEWRLYFRLYNLLKDKGLEWLMLPLLLALFAVLTGGILASTIIFAEVIYDLI